MMEKITLKKKVSLKIFRQNSYAVPNVKSFQKKFPGFKDYNSAVYLNERRIIGQSDYNSSTIFDTDTNGILGIETKNILEAIGLPREIIDKIEFK